MGRAMAALLSACGGGCYSHQENFQVTPAEPCIQPKLDVCDATAGTITLRNTCADALTIELGSADGGGSGRRDELRNHCARI
jgi:hypothetical protein